MASLADQARAMAEYNAWVIGKIYESCAPIPDAERKGDVGACCESIHGTLKRLRVADRIWMGRFAGPVFTVKGLDAELYADFDELRREREKTDAVISVWAGKLTDEGLQRALHYTPITN